MATVEPPERARARRPDLETVYTINTDGSRNFLHPADVSGRWQVRKYVVWAILIAVYAILPWIRVGGHPAVWIDIPHRQAFLFGRTFTNQDFYLVFFLVSGAGFALFALTALWGRIWCGFACPQTVWLEGVFRRIERWIEGKREVRLRRNRQPMSLDKLWRKGLKHLLFLALAAFAAHLFLAYFLPVRELLAAIGGPPRAHWTAFLWMAVMTGILYFDFAWFREQVCLVVCPYGRLQSVLIDRDTKLIGYDARRGEPRGKAGARPAGGDPAMAGGTGGGTASAGDCVDCARCVVVCPTGIDIRNGLQMECVGCANCIDACDEVMDRLGRPRGLVRYDSQRGFEEGRARPLLRPRVFLYAALGLAGLVVSTLAAGRRASFEVRALRSPGMPYVLERGSLRNVFQVDVQNKEDAPRTYFLHVEGGEAAVAGTGAGATGAQAGASSGDPELRGGPPASASSGRVAPGARPRIILPMDRVRLEAFADARVVAVATLALDAWREPIPLRFAVTDSASGVRREVLVKFLGP